jgi:pilus assembly protein TadC
MNEDGSTIVPADSGVVREVRLMWKAGLFIFLDVIFVFALMGLFIIEVKLAFSRQNNLAMVAC